jgi:farnesyl diphosphate synthase
VAQAADLVTVALDELLPRADGPEAQLTEAMRYAALGPGKRLRTFFALETGKMFDLPERSVLRAACALECIQAYSLIHDDLPCMDDDSLRRGKPTCHVAYDVATALLAGDALQSLAFAVIAAPGRAHPADADACRILAEAAGHAGMAGGQQLDLDATGATLGLSELTRMHALKTGALIRAAVRLGARCGRPLAREEVDALDRYARAAGLAFQVVDDVLDVEGSAATLGKTAGKDAAQNKATFVALLGLAEARRQAQALHAEARAALVPFAASGRRLAELADWIVLRTA